MLKDCRWVRDCRRLWSWVRGLCLGARGPRSRSRGRPSVPAIPQTSGGFCDGGNLRSRMRNCDETSGRGFGNFRNERSRRRGRRNEEYEAPRRRERAEIRRAGGWSDRHKIRRMECLRSRLSISRSQAEMSSRSRSRWRLRSRRRLRHSRPRLSSPRRISVEEYGRSRMRYRDRCPAISRDRAERSRDVRDVDDREIPKGCSDPRITKIRRTSYGEAVPRNGEAGRGPHRRSEVPHRQKTRSDLHFFRNFSGRRGACEEGGEQKLPGNGRRREKTAGVCTLGKWTAPPTEPRHVRRPLTQILAVTQRGGWETRRRSPSPITDHRVGQQPPMPRVPPREEKPHHQQEGPQPPTPPNGAPMSLPPSYTDIVARSGSNNRQDLDTHDGWQQVKRQRRPSPERHPVNPSMEGRCYHCLARDHRAQTCREPVWCRLCR